MPEDTTAVAGPIVSLLADLAHGTKQHFARGEGAAGVLVRAG